jgi:hypothetical protein
VKPEVISCSVVELHNRERLKDYSFIPYYEKFLPGSKVPISLETVYKAFTEDHPLLEYKANQAQHKKEYHIWNHRPLPPALLTYAAFDVASLREILKLFFQKLKLYQWGAFESAITRSRLTYEPKCKTCFTCLRTVPIEHFSNTQKKYLSHCRSCDTTGYYETNKIERVFEKEEPEVKTTIGTGLDILDNHPNIRLSEC